ncbi:hypothetical protein Tsubulata_032144, partial [Turnera subulata]
ERGQNRKNVFVCSIYFRLQHFAAATTWIVIIETLFCWSDLPCDLLEKIVNCHKSSRLYILRFRGVCRQWRSSIPLPPTYPSSLKLPFPVAPNLNGKVGCLEDGR